MRMDDAYAAVATTGGVKQVGGARGRRRAPEVTQRKRAASATTAKCEKKENGEREEQAARHPGRSPERSAAQEEGNPQRTMHPVGDEAGRRHSPPTAHGATRGANQGRRDIVGLGGPPPPGRGPTRWWRATGRPPLRRHTERPTRQRGSWSGRCPRRQSTHALAAQPAAARPERGEAKERSPGRLSSRTGTQLKDRAYCLVHVLFSLKSMDSWQREPSARAATAACRAQTSVARKKHTRAEGGGGRAYLSTGGWRWQRRAR